MRALISVTDKTGVVEFAKNLESIGVEIISTGNTLKILNENGVSANSIESVTNFPEILNGRVKTLSPYIHGGILYKRDDSNHVETVEELNIKPIDIVVCNLYDFEGTIKSNKGLEETIENIDIGGPSMIRSSAKNYKDVLIVTDNNDFECIFNKLKNNSITIEDRLNLSKKAFLLTARYDALISNYFLDLCGDTFPQSMTLTFDKEESLRYGENPHQNASLYKDSNSKRTILDYEQLNGKELSFNNINDLHGCLEVLREFKDETCAVAIKHTNPCGVGIANTSYEAFKKCYESDKISIFGGIVGINGTVDKETASLLSEIFLEIVCAYDFTSEALEILTKKKNLRVLRLNKIDIKTNKYDFKYLDGKLLVQENDELLDEGYEVMTKISPSEKELSDMKFGMKIVKNMKSNAIVIVKDGQTLASGCGQTSRIWALKNALENNKEKDFTGSVLCSDAFLPFDDCVKLANEYNIKSICQPGGSIKDIDSINTCDELEMNMVFTKVRHFKH
ncbi:MAG: bifunctional phosphoribosylaminoimidazolecarboxamide formyltransferase/IMP cyclohydrolase [Peptostreptococcaceae bacterium]